MSQPISLIREDFEIEISRIVRENTDKDSLEDFEKGDRVTIDGGEFEDLSISKNHGGNVKIEQYVNGNGQKSNMIRIDMDNEFIVEFQGVINNEYVETFDGSDMIEPIKDWTNTLSEQF